MALFNRLSHGFLFVVFLIIPLLSFSPFASAASYQTPGIGWADFSYGGVEGKCDRSMLSLIHI